MFAITRWLLCSIGLLSMIICLESTIAGNRASTFFLNYIWPSDWSSDHVDLPTFTVVTEVGKGIFFLNWRHHYRGNIWNLSFFLLSCVSGQSHEVWHHDCFPLAGPNMQQGFSCCLEYTEDHPKTRLIVLTVVFFKCTFLRVFRSLFAYILQIFLLSLFPFKFGTRPEN